MVLGSNNRLGTATLNDEEAVLGTAMMPGAATTAES
jgi:hypothetical protein